MHVVECGVGSICLSQNSSFLMFTQYHSSQGEHYPDTMYCVKSKLNNAFSLDGTLDGKAAQKRASFFYMNAILLVVLVANAIPSLGNVQGRYFYVFGYCSSAMSCIFVVTSVLCKCTLTNAHVVFATYTHCANVILTDMTARATSHSLEYLMVLVVDMLLVMQVPAKYSMGLVCFTVVYLIIIAAEEQYRFGVLDMPGLMPQEERWSRISDSVSCTVFPCKKNGMDYMLASILVFVIDFVATRGFAHGIMKEQASMERTISVVQEIASLLARYDVEQVASLLQVHGSTLPEEMVAALQKLEGNLRMYKAYLPQTCFPMEDGVKQREGAFEETFRDESDTSASTASQSESVSKDSSTLVQVHVLTPLFLSPAKATLLMVNMKASLGILEEDSARFSNLFTTLLVKTLHAVDTTRGMIDLFVGDRVHCSFNALKMKKCANHATSSLHAAGMLVQCEYVNMGVATGTVLRGDMGCDVMRRFSTVGNLVRDVNGLERAGRMLECDVVCNRMCFSDAECEHDLRLLPCKVELAPCCEAEVVAELMPNQETGRGMVVEEWMYAVGVKKHWEDYNTAVRGYLRGTTCDVEVGKAWRDAGGVGAPVSAVPSGTCKAVRCYLPSAPDVLAH